MAHRKNQKDMRDEGFLEDTRETATDAWTDVEHAGQEGAEKIGKASKKAADEVRDVVQGEDYEDTI